MYKIDVFTTNGDLPENQQLDIVKKAVLLIREQFANKITNGVPSFYDNSVYVNAKRSELLECLREISLISDVRFLVSQTTYSEVANGIIDTNHVRILQKMKMQSEEL